MNVFGKPRTNRLAWLTDERTDARLSLEEWQSLVDCLRIGFLRGTITSPYGYIVLSRELDRLAEELADFS